MALRGCGLEGRKQRPLRRTPARWQAGVSHEGLLAIVAAIAVLPRLCCHWTGGSPSPWALVFQRGPVAPTQERAPRPPGGTRARRKRAAPGPGALTSRFKASKTAADLVQVADGASREMSLNAIHLSAAFGKLAALRASLTADVAGSSALRELSRQTKRLMARQEIGGREMSSILLAVSALRSDIPWLQELIAPALEVLPQQVDSMTPQALSSVIAAIGSLEVESAETARVLNLLQRATLSRLDNFTMIDVAQVLWGLANHGEMDAKLAMPLASFVQKKAGQVSTKSALTDLPQIACAWVRLGQWHRPAMEEIAFRVDPVLKRLRLWSLAALMWSWTQPCAPPQVARVVSGHSRSRQVVIANFVHQLQDQVESRGISKADIARSPLGPKASR